MAEKRSITMKIHIDDLRSELKAKHNAIILHESHIVTWAVNIAGLFIAVLPKVSPKASSSEAIVRTGIALAVRPFLIELLIRDAAIIAMRINEMESAGENIFYIHMLCKEVDKIGRGYSVPTFDVIEEYYDFNEYSRYE